MNKNMLVDINISHFIIYIGKVVKKGKTELYLLSKYKKPNTHSYINEYLEFVKKHGFDEGNTNYGRLVSVVTNLEKLISLNKPESNDSLLSKEVVKMYKKDKQLYITVKYSFE